MTFWSYPIKKYNPVKSKDWQNVCQHVRNVEQGYFKIYFINNEENGNIITWATDSDPDGEESDEWLRSDTDILHGT